MKQYQIRLTKEAEEDLIDLFEYIARKDSVDKAFYVLNQLETIIQNLKEMPERGNYPPELENQGIKDYREIHFKPYRVIYQVIGHHIAVLGCFDGRRDMQSVLERRMLR